MMDERLLRYAIEVRDELEGAQDTVERVRAKFHRAVRHLHIEGATLREIADALGLSHQRVHQIVGQALPEPARNSEARDHLLRCSFCTKSQKSVKKLIAGPGVYICDECLAVVSDVILGRVTNAPIVLLEPSATTCSFCGKRRKRVQWIAEGGPGASVRICDECTALCDSIISEET